MIEFLESYTTKSIPPESFAAKQQVERSEESERYFVGRGLAAYVIDGKLFDMDHRPIVANTVVVEVVRPGDRRGGIDARAGEVMTGQPPRASSRPGASLFDAVGASLEGTPSVVLEAEVQRITAALGSAKSERDGLATALDQAVGDLQAERQAHAATRNDLASAKTAVATADGARADAEKEVGELKSRIVSLEQQIAAAAKPAGDEKPGTDEQTATDAPSKKAK